MKNNKQLAYYSMYLAIFIFIAMTPFIGFIKIGVLSITTMYIPFIVISIHMGYKGALVGGVLFGISAFFNGIAYNGVIVALVGGVGNLFILAVLSRITLGILVAILILFIRKITNNIFIIVLIITINTLILNFILFISLLSVLSHNTFYFFLVSSLLNISVEWPLTIFISLSFIPIFKSFEHRSYEGY